MTVVPPPPPGPRGPAIGAADLEEHTITAETPDAAPTDGPPADPRRVIAIDPETGDAIDPAEGAAPDTEHLGDETTDGAARAEESDFRDATTPADDADPPTDTSSDDADPPRDAGLPDETTPPRVATAPDEPDRCDDTGSPQPAPVDPSPRPEDEGEAVPEQREPDGPTFADLALRPELVEALGRLGYEEPTPIQREAIPTVLGGRDLVAQAATGTGKTAAFALPILQRLTDGHRGPQPTALVLVPTRELAIQVSEAIHRYGRALDARVLPIYGGQPIFRQLRALDEGIDVVVATPGRAIDHIGRRSLVLDSVATVVLDEADEMLDMGFAEDIEEILDRAPDERQTVLFSATMPGRIEAIAKRHLTDAARILMGRETTPEGEPPKVRQTAYLVKRPHKATALGRILDVESPNAAIVFCRTRAEVDQLTETLNGRGYRAEALHGGMDQSQRDRVMSRLRGGTADLLVATDVAARGLDIDQLTHVVNYDVPSAPEAYVHRIGRVGRAGREGVAITLAEPREHRQLKTIERVTKQRIAVEQVPSVSDLRARRLEVTRAALQEILVGDDVDSVRAVVESLSDEFDLMEVALAAVKMAHEATAALGGDDDEDIPVVHLAPERNQGKGASSDRGSKGRSSSAPRSYDSGPQGGRSNGGSRHRATGAEMTRLFVSAGRSARIRPGDLVGAIAGETSLSGRDIGAIEIADAFSLVEVPSDKVDEVIEGLRSTTLRGKRVTARRERF